jgi:hypothetical protein
MVGGSIWKFRPPRFLRVSAKHRAIAVDFTPYRVVAVGVFDPSPAIGGPRTLSPSEIVQMNRGGQLRFLAALTLTSVIEKAGNDASDDSHE